MSLRPRRPPRRRGARTSLRVVRRGAWRRGSRCFGPRLPGSGRRRRRAAGGAPTSGASGAGSVPCARTGRGRRADRMTPHPLDAPARGSSIRSSGTRRSHTSPEIGLVESRSTTGTWNRGGGIVVSTVTAGSRDAVVPRGASILVDAFRAATLQPAPGTRGSEAGVNGVRRPRDRLLAGPPWPQCGVRRVASTEGR